MGVVLVWLWVWFYIELPVPEIGFWRLAPMSMCCALKSCVEFSVLVKLVM